MHQVVNPTGTTGSILMNAKLYMPVVAVIGGGFTGAAFAVHVARSACQPIKLLIIDPREKLGLGLAYGSASPEHRINVPSDKMIVLPDKPLDFTDWLKSTGIFNEDSAALTELGHHYSRRIDFGSYVSDLLQRCLANSKCQAEHVRASAIAVQRSLQPESRSYEITLDSGNTLQADVVVITASHAAPNLPCKLESSVASNSRIITNPWRNRVLDSIDNDASVVIAGTGLTMCDMVMSLRKKGHRASILAISRRALTPRLQAEFVDGFKLAGHGPTPTTARTLLKLVRDSVRNAEAAALTWRAALDAARSRAPELWQSLPLSEQIRLRRRLLVYWDAHRFRMAPQVAQTLEDGQSNGWLRIEPGRLLGIEEAPNGTLLVRWQSRNTPPTLTPAGAFINCVGPDGDLSRSSNPIFQSLITQGLAQPDPLRLGLECDTEGRLKNSDGQFSCTLRVAGPLAKAAVGEIVGVPEASAHARTVAESLGKYLMLMDQHKESAHSL